MQKEERKFSHRIRNLEEYSGKRRELRRNLTPAEAFLWKLLKGRQLCGKGFRRQYSLVAFVFDFYCPEEKLAVELDGADHFSEDGRRNDARKIAFAAKHGIRILHFENREVFAGAGAQVLEKIAAHFRAR